MRNPSENNLYSCWQFQKQYQDQDEMWKMNTVNQCFEGSDGENFTAAG